MVPLCQNVRRGQGSPQQQIVELHHHFKTQTADKDERDQNTERGTLFSQWSMDHTPDALSILHVNVAVSDICLLTRKNRGTSFWKVLKSLEIFKHKKQSPKAIWQKNPFIPTCFESTTMIGSVGNMKKLTRPCQPETLRARSWPKDMHRLNCVKRKPKLWLRQNKTKAWPRTLLNLCIRAPESAN